MSVTQGSMPSMGVSAKNKKTAAQIDSLIYRIRENYRQAISIELMDFILNKLREYLLFSPKSKQEKLTKELLRENLMNKLNNCQSAEFIDEICKHLYRPSKEMYIPLPNSRIFHQTHPDFFGEGVGTLIKDGSKWKLAKSVHERIFTMVFEPSGDEMKMFISQDAGKAIESCGRQEIFNVLKEHDRWLLCSDYLD